MGIFKAKAFPFPYNYRNLTMSYQRQSNYRRSDGMEYSPPTLPELSDKIIHSVRTVRDYDTAKKLFMELHNFAQNKMTHPKYPDQMYELPSNDVRAIQAAFKAMVRYAPNAKESNRIYLLLIEHYQEPIRSDTVINRCLISLVYNYAATTKSKEDMDMGLGLIKQAVDRGIAVPQDQRPIYQRQNLHYDEDPEGDVIRSVSKNILAHFQMQISEDGLRVEKYSPIPTIPYSTEKVAAWHSFSETQQGSNDNSGSSGNISGNGLINNTEINAGNPTVVSSTYDTNERQSRQNMPEENQSNHHSGQSSPSNQSRRTSVDSEPLLPRPTGRLAAASSPLNFALGFDSALCYPNGIEQVLLEVAHLKLEDTYSNADNTKKDEDGSSREDKNLTETPTIDGENDHNTTNQTEEIVPSQEDYKEQEQPNVYEDDDFQQRYLQGEGEGEGEGEYEEEPEESATEVNPDISLSSSRQRTLDDVILFTPTTTVTDEKNKLTAEELANRMTEE